jgi:hypothetical protein
MPVNNNKTLLNKWKRLLNNIKFPDFFAIKLKRMMLMFAERVFGGWAAKSERKPERIIRKSKSISSRPVRHLPHAAPIKNPRRWKMKKKRKRIYHF